jgi:P pilus assembly chaperone PapD
MDIQRGQLHADHRVHAVDTLIAAIAAVAVLSAAPAAAQTSVEVSPLRIELKAEPGGTTTQAITVSNTGPQPVRVRATISDWHLSRDGAPQFVEATDAKYSASGWVRVAPPEIVVDAGKEATVRFTLTVPAGTSPAGYRTGILFEFSPPSGAAAAARGRSVAFRSRIATLIYANVGEPPAALELTDLQIRRVPDQPVQVIAVLKNTSRRSVRTKGTLTLYDKSGAVVSQTVVPDVPVLPESEREIAIVAINPDKPAPPPGEYRVEVKIDVGMPALIVGETTIKVS